MFMRGSAKRIDRALGQGPTTELSLAAAHMVPAAGRVDWRRGGARATSPLLFLHLTKLAPLFLLDTIFQLGYISNRAITSPFMDIFRRFDRFDTSPRLKKSESDKVVVRIWSLGVCDR